MTPQWQLVTGPTTEPITLAEAKLQAGITQTTEDTLTVSYIQAAREEAESYMHRGLYTQTWKLVLDSFYDVIWLPMADPLQSVTSIQYYDDTAGALQTLTTGYYTVDTVSRPGRIVRAPNQYWPSLQTDRDALSVVITYVVGWTTTAAIPEKIKQGIRMWVTYLACDREGLNEYADQARTSAANCWTDVVSWREPENYCYSRT